MIVDILGIKDLAWGNQCFMTMIESMTLSIISLILLSWETYKRFDLIVRETGQMNLEKIGMLEKGDFEDEEPDSAVPKKRPRGYS